MDQVRVAICDDSEDWLSREARLLHDYADGQGVTLSLFAHSLSGKLFEELDKAPDALFCDIELQDDESGIDLVRAVNRRWPACQVVYVTNYLRYAPEVYVTDHLWFVMKDQFEERLPEVMGKLRAQMRERMEHLSLTTTDRAMASLPCAEISFFERRGRTTTINMLDGSQHVVSERLGELLGRLPESAFVRSHGSYAVNLGQVRLVQSDMLMMANGAKVPLSRRFSRSFRNRFLIWCDNHAI